VDGSSSHLLTARPFGHVGHPHRRPLAALPAPFAVLVKLTPRHVAAVVRTLLRRPLITRRPPSFAFRRTGLQGGDDLLLRRSQHDAPRVGVAQTVPVIRPNESDPVYVASTVRTSIG